MPYDTTKHLLSYICDRGCTEPIGFVHVHGTEFGHVRSLGSATAQPLQRLIAFVNSRSNSRHDQLHSSPLPRLLCIGSPAPVIVDAIDAMQTTIRCTLLRCLLDIVARPICQDGARNNVKEMIPPWRDSGLADEPAERRHQGEQVDPIHIGARRSLGLSTEQ